MGRNHATTATDSESTDDRRSTAERTRRDVSPAHAGAPTVTIAATSTGRDRPDDAPRPNTLTIIGHGTPASFELTVDGEIELLEEESASDATIVSGSTVEGTIESGTLRFRFTGDLTDVTFVDRRITGLSPAAAPNVHVDYPAPEGTQS